MSGSPPSSAARSSISRSAASTRARSAATEVRDRGRRVVDIAARCQLPGKGDDEERVSIACGEHAVDHRVVNCGAKSVRIEHLPHGCRSEGTEGQPDHAVEQRDVGHQRRRTGGTRGDDHDEAGPGIALNGMSQCRSCIGCQVVEVVDDDQPWRGTQQVVEHGAPNDVRFRIDVRSQRRGGITSEAADEIPYRSQGRATPINAAAGSCSADPWRWLARPPSCRFPVRP